MIGFTAITSQRLLRLGWALLCWLSVAGCSSLPEPVGKSNTWAMPVQAGSHLGRLVAQHAPNEHLSGFRLLVSGEEAFETFLALADRAEHTLDLQYYLIKSDQSAFTIMQRVRAAADRGVRVRILLDDLNTAGQDEGWLAMTRHPNIEVRLFNPFPVGRFSTFTRIVGNFTDFSRINSRMHNKMFVADNAMAVTGGRNLGDTYFLRDENSNFLDVDLIVAGPDVRALSAIFDRFWNHRLAYPVSALVAPHVGQAGEPPARELSLTSTASNVVSDLESDAQEGFADELSRDQLSLIWAPSDVWSDRPAKLELPAHQVSREDTATLDAVLKLMSEAQKEVVLISPYLVPGPKHLALFQSLRERGVQVRILTNSLATTDAPAVHVGYSGQRRALLDAGVSLHELKTRLKPSKGSRWRWLGASLASLHAKVLLVDGQHCVVGSMNFDPRSESLNTEMALHVVSDVLGEQIQELYEEVRDSSYEVFLNDAGELRWRLQEGDLTVILNQEPDASMWLKMGLLLMHPFAPDELL